MQVAFSYKYKDKELKQLLDSMVVLSDTREQVNQHILSYFQKKNTKYKTQKLDFGDYSCILPQNKGLCIERDIYFHNTITIERKGSLEELSNNFTKERSRIEEEFTRAKGKVILLVENATYEDIVNHNYNTQYEPKSFIATLKAFEARYNISTQFVSKKYTGNFIYHTLLYHVREYLKA